MKALQKIAISALLVCAVSHAVYAQTPKFYAAVNNNTNNGRNFFCGAASGTVSVRNSADGSSPSGAIQWDEGILVSTNSDGTENFTVTNSYIGQGPDFTFNLSSGATKSYRAMVMVLGNPIYSSSVTLSSYTPPVAGTLAGAATFLNSGSGSLTYTGGSGSVQWMMKTPADLQWTNIDPLVNGNYTITQTMQYAVRRYNPSTYFANGYYNNICPDVTTPPVTVEVYKVGTITGPSSAVEGSRITLGVSSFYKNVIRWESSIDGGSTWSYINFPYTSLRYEIVANTAFRVLIDLGPFGTAYTPSYNVTYSAYSQFDHSLVNGNNSVKKQNITVKNITDPSSVNGLSIYQKQEAISYMDGRGRTIQQNLRSASPLQKDIVTFTDYDRQGRQPAKYQPYVSATNDGLYKSDPFGDQLSFYSNPVEDKITNTSQPFAVSVYENSPLGRLIEQGSPGSLWQPGGGHSKLMQYANNAANDVRQFNTDGSSSGFYTANSLVLAQGTDEDGKKKQVYTDTQGRTILSRTQLDETVNGVYTSWLETYYIFNDRDAIRYIVSPKGVAALNANGWQWTTTIKDQYVHELVYDTRGRLTQKKVPGQNWMYYCYDRFDRLVLAQDGILRAQNNWMFFKYDKKGRVVRQGLYTDNVNTTVSAMQSVIDPLYANTTDVFFEDDAASNYCFPTTNITNLVRNYYDNSTQTYTPQGLLNEGTPGSNTGLLTSSVRSVLNSPMFLTSYYFYDAEGRLIQELSNNHLSSTLDNLKTYVYDFTGKVTLFKTYHHVAATTATIMNRYFYDPAGRLKQVFQQNNTDPEVLLVHYNYNEVGQLVEKNLHCTTCSPDLTGQTTYTNSQFLQSVDMRYDVRGKLASINNAQLNVNSANNDDANDYFGMEFLYENGLTSTGLYNGNMGAVKWKSAGGGQSGSTDQQSYQYTYDKANRLRSATSQVFDGTAWAKEANAQNESMGYDLNGNIQSLQRNARSYSMVMNNGKPTTSYAQGSIDDLTYTYNSNLGDQLLRVTDAASKAAGFDNGTSTTNNDYTYDVNGNVLTDSNKGISNITYNYLGKPTQVNFSDGRQIIYVYDAAGNKLTRSTTVSGTTTTTNYVKGFVYNTTGAISTLNFFSSTEGRVIKNGSAFEYQYAIADHQGNTRVVFTSATPTPQSVTATFEGANQPMEATQFSNYGHISAAANHTTGGTYSQYLNGGYAGMVGVAKSYKVFPGDQLKIEAYGSYNAPGAGSSSLASFAGALLAALSLPAPAGGETGTASAGVNTWGGIEAAGFGEGSNDNTDPKAFVNIVLFDKNYNFLDVAYAQLKGTSLYYMTASYTVKEAGYAYFYVSNEQATQTDVYFDDVKMTYTPTNIIQYNEYYPFGLQTSSSWTRDNSSNNFLYDAGNELNTTTGIYETMFRGYDPTLGRFMQVDPLAILDAPTSPFAYAQNNPINSNDPLGLLDATQDELMAFVNAALAGNGGAWSEDGPPHLFTGEEAAAMGQSLENGNGSGSYISSNGNGTATGVSWNITSEQFIVTVSTGPLSKNGGILDGPNTTMSTTSIDIPSSLQETASAYSSASGSNDWQYNKTVDWALTTAGFASDGFNTSGEIAAYHVAKGMQKITTQQAVGLSRLTKWTGFAGVGVSAGVAYYEYQTGHFDTHTVVDLGVTSVLFAVGVGATILGAPLVLTGVAVTGLVYGIASAAGSDSLDNATGHWGAGLVYPK